MKKTLLIFMCLIMCFSFFTGCGSSDTTKTATQPVDPAAQAESDTLLSNEEIAYVMIYNPNIYDELQSRNPMLSTGDFDEYVEAVISRADGLGGVTPEFLPRSIWETGSGLELDKFEIGGGRSGSFIVPYEVGDTRDFYCGSDTRRMQTFTCIYAGEYCNIWTYNNSISQNEAKKFGEEFDTNIYTKATNMFGDSRFASNGGNVNLLFYPMEDHLGGFFHPYDLFASDEVSEAERRSYCVNTDHDIVNINSKLAHATDYVNSTMAHEFQHLICFTNYFSTYGNGINMRTWLNEAMSGYIEEQLYPGAKDISGHYDAFSTSSRIRHGQSMYNFETTTTNSEFDIGVYGSVYLFSEYLANLAGDDVFSGIHSYWRDSYSSTLDEAEAIVNSVSSDVYNNINGLVDFGGKVDFADENDEWLSKLTLDFYLSLLKVDNSDPDAYQKIEAQALLYDEINPADIEGGGRVIAALKNGEFKFPENADEGLVYIGLNKNFEVVTEYVVR